LEPETQNVDQIGAIPLRRVQSGAVEVLLVTSRQTKRWVIPKGWPWPNCTDHLSAAGEAFEEAGIVGGVETIPFGTYAYVKRLETGMVKYGVTAFLLWVEQIFDNWPERRQRTRAWFSPDDAANAVQEVQLKAMLRALSDLPIQRVSELDHSTRDLYG
jgi:8-oxo-dGTP pyrophosphatase MutT (NUDIX family)